MPIKGNYSLCKASLFILAAIGVLAVNTSRANAGSEFDVDDIDVYRVSTYYGEDSSYALQLSADWAVTNATKFDLAGAYMRAKGAAETLDSYQASAALDHRFGPWGAALQANFRDDGGVVTTAGVQGRGYYRGERVDVGLLLARNRIEVTYDLPPILRPYLDESPSTYGTKYGIDLRYTQAAFGLYANVADYSYDEPLTSLTARRDSGRVPSDRLPLLQERLAKIRAQLGGVNFATLRLATNLLDYSVIVGSDYRIGEHLLNLELSREQVEADSVIIDSIDIGWTFPIADTVDMEIRLGSAKVEDANSLLYGSLNFTFYR